MSAEFDPEPILGTLVRHDVAFVLIGGLAGIVLGSACRTKDKLLATELRVISDELRAPRDDG